MSRTQGRGVTSPTNGRADRADAVADLLAAVIERLAREQAERDRDAA